MAKWEETRKLAEDIDPQEKSGQFVHITHETARKIADKLYDVAAAEDEEGCARTEKP